MGVTYTVIPIGTLHDDESVRWFQELGLTLPILPELSREPTLLEIREVLASFEEYIVEYLGADTQTLQVTISHREKPAWASLIILDYSATSEEENIAHPFYFDGGWEEVIIAILERLARKCGPFVLLKNGENPKLVFFKEVEDTP